MPLRRHQRPGASSTPATSPRCCQSLVPRARCSSSTRSTGWRARPRRCSTSRWRTSGSTSSWARGRAPPRSRSSSRRSPWSAPRRGPGCCPARCATGSASPPTWTSTTPTDLERDPRAAPRRLLDVALDRRRRPPRSPAARRGTPRVANRLLRRVRDFAQVRGDGVVDLDGAGGARRSTRSTRSASTGSTGRCSTRCSAGSAADRSALSTLAVAVGEESRDGRDGRRAVPGPGRVPRPHPAGPGRHARGLGAPRAPAPRRRGAAPCPFDEVEAVDDRDRLAGRRSPGRRRDRRAPPWRSARCCPSCCSSRRSGCSSCARRSARQNARPTRSCAARRRARGHDDRGPVRHDHGRRRRPGRARDRPRGARPRTSRRPSPRSSSRRRAGDRGTSSTAEPSIVEATRLRRSPGSDHGPRPSYCSGTAPHGGRGRTDRSGGTYIGGRQVVTGGPAPGGHEGSRAGRTTSPAGRTGDTTVAAPTQGPSRPGRTLAVLGRHRRRARRVDVLARPDEHAQARSRPARRHPGHPDADRRRHRAPRSTDDQLEQAMEIIRQRVDGFGVAESEVTTQGSGQNASIIVSIPGVTNQAILDSLVDHRAARLPPRLQHRLRRPAADADRVRQRRRPSPERLGHRRQAPRPRRRAPRATAPPSTGGLRARRRHRQPAPPSASPSPSATAHRRPARPQRAADPGGSQRRRPAGRRSSPSTAARRRATKGGPADPTKYIVDLRHATASLKYLLDPAAVQGTEIASAVGRPLAERRAAGRSTSTFTPKGAKQFAEVTGQLAQQPPPQNQFAIVLDGLVQSAPSVNDRDPRRQRRHHRLVHRRRGQGARQRAQVRLAAGLARGVLGRAAVAHPRRGPAPRRPHRRCARPAAGGHLPRRLLPRRSALVAVASLLVAAAHHLRRCSCILGRQLGFTLSLAGVAGAIVAIGITADSFVVYFERIRDEIREGRSLRAAGDAGWIRARRTILAADFVSLLAAVVLYFLSVGSVRGFAFTLGLTTLVDVLVAFLFTRPLVSLLMRTSWFTSGKPVDRAVAGPARASSPASPRRRTAGRHAARRRSPDVPPRHARRTTSTAARSPTTSSASAVAGTRISGGHPACSRSSACSVAASTSASSSRAARSSPSRTRPPRSRRRARPSRRRGVDRPDRHPGRRPSRHPHPDRGAHADGVGRRSPSRWPRTSASPQGDIAVTLVGPSWGGEITKTAVHGPRRLPRARGRVPVGLLRVAAGHRGARRARPRPRHHDRHLRADRVRGDARHGDRRAHHPRLLALRHRRRVRQGEGEHPRHHRRATG